MPRQSAIIYLGFALPQSSRGGRIRNGELRFFRILHPALHQMGFTVSSPLPGDSPFKWPFHLSPRWSPLRRGSRLVLSLWHFPYFTSWHAPARKATPVRGHFCSWCSDFPPFYVKGDRSPVELWYYYIKHNLWQEIVVG